MTSDTENGAVYAAVNLLVLVVMRVAIHMTRSELLRDTTVGCVAFAGMYTLPVAQMCTLMWVVVLLRSADLHGVFRPTIWMRIGVLLLTLIVAVPDVIMMASDWGPHVLTSGSIPLDAADIGHPVFACRPNLNPRHDPLPSYRVLIGLRGLAAAIATLILQDERGIVVVSMGDRITRELEVLSARMLMRKQVVFKVVRQLIPSALLGVIREQIDGRD